MPRDKTESHRKIMEAAREEFLAYGFEKASMRRIGERCSMTAAAIYRHCRDKEDLFDQLVRPAEERIFSWIQGHIDRYVEAAQAEERLSLRDTEIDMMREVVYPDMETYHLLLACSQGTRYENFLHDLTQKSQEQMFRYLHFLKEKGYGVKDITPRELHILLTAYTTALFEPVIHRYPEKEALCCLDKVSDFFLPGWKNLFGL